MPRSRLVLMLVVILALVLPSAAVAQVNTPPGGLFALSASLTGGAEVPGPGDPDGFGFARLTVDLTTGEICYRLSVARVDDITASHIHVGGPGVAGPVVVPLDPPVTGLSTGCVNADPALAADIVANPGGYYINVHSAEHAPGAVRGQLQPVNYVVTPEGPQTPEWTIETLAEGLTFPHGIEVGDEAVYVTDGGMEPAPGPDDCVVVGEGEEASEYCFVNSGRIVMADDAGQTVVVDGLPGTTGDVVVGDDGTFYVLTGLGGDPTILRAAAGDLMNGYGALLEVDPATGDWTVIADVAAYEAEANPDGGLIDSNPYSLLMVDDGFLVVDAGMNAVVHVSMTGEITTVAVFDARMVDAPPFLELPPGTQIPMESVPTSIAVGPDGAYYVSELTGFPFEVGASRVFRMEDTNGDGDALDEGELTVAHSGFTALVDLAFDSNGELWVLSIAKEGLLAAEDPENPAGFVSALIHVGADGTQTEILAGQLMAASGLAAGSDGALYVTNFGVMPGMGELARIARGE
jgi:hypothetical protein